MQDRFSTLQVLAKHTAQLQGQCDRQANHFHDSSMFLAELQGTLVGQSCFVQGWWSECLQWSGEGWKRQWPHGLLPRRCSAKVFETGNWFLAVCLVWVCCLLLIALFRSVLMYVLQFFISRKYWSPRIVFVERYGIVFLYNTRVGVTKGWTMEQKPRICITCGLSYNCSQKLIACATL